MSAVQQRFNELLAARWRLGYNNSDPGARTRLWDEAVKGVKASEAEARRILVGREQAERQALRRAIADGEGDLASLYTSAAESIGREHRITIEWREPSAMPSGASAYADWNSRRIVVPVIAGTRQEIEERFATVAHECAHILAGVCGGGDHQPDPTVTRWHHCLRCEQLAWEQALELWPFTRAMFDRLRSALGTYRRGTPGPSSATNAVDRTRGSLRFAEHRQRRLNRSVEVARARHEWALLTAQERVDRQVAEQRRRREQMRRVAT